MRAFLNLYAVIVALFFSVAGQAALHPGPGKELLKSVDEKQAAAIKLINTVGSAANERFSNEQEKEDAQFAYSGFMARFESLREDREALERKEIVPDSETLEKYSKQYDRLISDLNAYLNRGQDEETF